MREILFRGRSIFDNKWHFGLLCNHTEGGAAIRDFECGDSLYSVDPETVGQYTGLKDVNGGRIFEGDVVCSATDIGIKWLISYNESSAMFCAAFPDYPTSSIRGICKGESGYWMLFGNIHDNPELLNTEKEKGNGNGNDV